MAKAMLILDDMPESCTDCRLCMHIENFGMYCPGLHEEVLMDTFDRCPLKELPERIDYTQEKKYLSKADKIFYEGHDIGWNKCLDAIEGTEG